jgi:anti-sigma regulatory factor (Ser/Thr protein kinase)
MGYDRSYGSENECFTVDDLQRLRALVERAGTRAGLSEPNAEDLVTAVNEVAVNAVLYAGGGGWITIAQSPEGVSVEISDDGPGLPAGVAPHLPPPRALGGRGLWMARRLCKRFTISSSPRGVTVRMFMPIRFAEACA